MFTYIFNAKNVFLMHGMYSLLHCFIFVVSCQCLGFLHTPCFFGLMFFGGFERGGLLLLSWCKFVDVVIEFIMSLQELRVSGD